MTEWEEDCMRWWGRILTGNYKHWCWDWDDLPIDDTVEEFKYCTCEKEHEQNNQERTK